MIDLNSLALAQLADELLGGEEAARLMALASYEDAREIGDITTASIIEPGRMASGLLAARQAGVVAGLAVAVRYLRQAGLDAAMQPLTADGDLCAAGQPIARIECPLADMLLHERPVLNFLGRLSGIATLTRAYVDAVAGTKAVICDTRKTTPGMRIMEKYAVRCGGGTLHRIGLYDAALYKDNHIAHIPLGELAAALGDAARTVRKRHEVRFVEVEVDSLEQFEQVLRIERGLIDLVLLDNMDADQLARAVGMRDAAKSRIQLEASGGVDLAVVRGIAEAGVDRIAVGALTHGSTWLDIGLDIEAAR
jgi:nicotinate-nucleotide pyrophosphorylase (carboxylating)